jgi:hypothetical protein
LFRHIQTPTISWSKWYQRKRENHVVYKYIYTLFIWRQGEQSYIIGCVNI